jgi:hypothetical protein
MTASRPAAVLAAGVPAIAGDRGDEEGPARQQQRCRASDARQCGSAAARPSWAATLCRRRSRVHNLLPSVSRAAANKWASTYPMPRSNKVLAIDQIKHFLVCGDDRLGQIPQVAEDGIPPPQIAERQLGQHEGAPENLAAAEQSTEYRVGRAQMIDPDDVSTRITRVSSVGVGSPRDRVRCRRAAPAAARLRARSAPEALRGPAPISHIFRFRPRPLPTARRRALWSCACSSRDRTDINTDII